MNLNLKNFFLIIGILIFSVMLTVIYFSHNIHFYSVTIKNVEENRVKLLSTVKILQQSSDDLTKFARLYVVTEKREFKENFNSILNIRKGLEPRPKEYGTIYWDFFEPERSLRHENASPKSFLSLIRELPFDDTEIGLLIESEKSSNRVAEIGIEAFNLMAGLYKDENGNYSKFGEPNKSLAIEILHSERYLKEKEKIMRPLDDLLKHLENRLQIETKNLNNSLELYLSLLKTVTFFSLFIFISIFFLLIRKILNPVVRLTEEIRIFQKDREKIFKTKIYYNDEIGFMAKEFENMKNIIQEDFKKIESREKKIKDYVDLIDQHVITSSTDLAGVITYVSGAFVEISGYSKKELLGKHHSIVRHEDMPQDLYKELWENLSNDKSWRGEIKNRRKDGSFYWVKTNISPVFNEKGSKIGYRSVEINISNEKRIEDLLVRDNLTSLYNRRFFNEKLPLLLNFARKERRYVSLLLFDIDNFRDYNDIYGHIAGDEVIREIAKVIKEEATRSNDYIFRLAGEEFAILFETIQQKDAIAFANKIREKIENLKIVHSKNGDFKFVTASFGLSVKKTTDDFDEEELYREADTFLTIAKSSGKNRVISNEKG
jgi:diguanylate cyclase (GGDEF)-like protein/PAS domain S-box-containing protein